MEIVNITANATSARYPQKIVILLEWDEPIVSFEVENLIFETQFEPGITITGYTPASDKPAPYGVFLGQTLIKDVTLVSPTTMRMAFTVSPFMQGTLKVSNQPWNKPLYLSAKNGAGVEGDWAALLAPGAFDSIFCTAYYSAMSPTQGTSINFDQPLYGTPKLRLNWACNNDGVVKANTGVDIRISDTNDFTPKPIEYWDGGNFWWWTAAGAKCSKDPQPPYPWGPYYGTSDPRVCSGPPEYLFGGVGGQVITSTQLPTYLATTDWTATTNSFGSKLAVNYNSNNLLYYSSCPIFGSSPNNKYTSRNASVGRMEGWILANPEHGDPLRDMPLTWSRQTPASSNGGCLAPWRLAKNSDPIPMLIQVYYQLNWIYTTSNPG